MYFISFRLKSALTEYPDLERAMKALGSWSNRFETNWFVESKLSARALRDLLKPHLKDGDRLFVGQFNQNWAANNMGDGFAEWMKRRDFGPKLVVEKPAVKADKK